MELPSFKFAGNTLLKLLISSATILPVTSTFVAAAPAVTGKNGCIIKYGAAVAGSQGGDNAQMQYQKCDPNAYNSTFDSRGMEFGNFVTADEVNNAFQQIQNEYQNYVNTVVNNNNNNAANDAKNAEQDGRLDAIEDKNVEQDGRLDAVEQKNAEQDSRLDGHDKDIADIKKNGVFYNTDAQGNKTGGLTLNDGTGNPVQIGNVAAGQNATDAVNVAQLDSTVAALGGGAKINPDGTVQAPVYEVAGLQYNNVGDALKATYESGVQYVTDANGKRTNDIVLTGDGTGPVTIHNVADGKADTDAANVRQVKQATQDAKTYTDQRIVELQSQSSNQFSALSSQIERNLQETRGGIASAMGMAALRFDNNPGKLSFASGMGSFKGATSVVAGMGYTSEDGLVRVNASMGYNFGENDLSWNAGASFTLN